MEDRAQPFADAVAGELSRAQHASEAVLARWHVEQRLLWGSFAQKLDALTSNLRTAHHSLLAEAGDMTVPSREQARRVFSWIADFDKHVSEAQEQVWHLTREAAAKEKVHTAVLREALATVTRTAQRIAQDSQAALAAASDSDRPLLDDARRERVSAVTAGLEAHLHAAQQLADDMRARVAAFERERVPDFHLAAQKFFAQLGRAAPAERARPRPRSVGPKRHYARIPQFLLNRFYVKGSLSQTAQGVSFTLRNPLAFAIIIGGDPCRLDGVSISNSRTTLDNGVPVIAAEVTPDNGVKFARGKELRVIFHDLRLRAGSHTLRMSIELRKLGWVVIETVDTLR